MPAVIEQESIKADEKPVETEIEPVKAKKYNRRAKKVKFTETAPVKAEIVEKVEESECNTSVSTAVTQQVDEQAHRDTFMAWANNLDENISKVKLLRRGQEFKRVKKVYESTPYAGTLPVYGPKPEKKKDEKENSWKKDKKSNDKKNRKPKQEEKPKIP